MKNRKIPRFLIILLIGITVFFIHFIFFDFFINKIVQIKIKDSSFNLLDLIEKKSFDILIKIKSKLPKYSRFFSKSYLKKDLKAKNISQEIMIVAIDDKSLNSIGSWPFKRYMHGRLTDYFTDSKYRENVLFFDIFFTEPDTSNPEFDILFLDSIKKNDRIIFDYPAGDEFYSDQKLFDEMTKRFNVYKNKFGDLKNISGSLEKANKFLSVNLPLIPYLNNIKETGYANTNEDFDKIVRKYPLVSNLKFREKKKLDEITEGDNYDILYASGFKITLYEGTLDLGENIYQIFNQSKIPIKQRQSLNSSDVQSIKSKIESLENNFKLDLEKLRGLIIREHKKIIKKINIHLKSSKLPVDFKAQIAKVINDETNIKDLDYILKSLINSLNDAQKKDKVILNEIVFFTKLYDKCIKVNRSFGIDENLSLYDYLYNNVNLSFNEVYYDYDNFVMSVPLILIMKHYNINKEDINVVFGKHIILNNPKVYDNKENKFKKVYRRGKELKSIYIPINNEGFIDISFAGVSSSSVISSGSTFDVYSYSDFIEGSGVYVKDKIILVGAFSKGMADDLYQTPLQTMYGIEVIANTLNTIIMNDYIKRINPVLCLIILFLITIIIAILSSSKSIIKAFIFVVAFLLLYNLLAVILFLFGNIIIQIPRVYIIAILTIISIMVFRIFTEEKQKKRIKEIFGKYVNPSIVEQLFDNPPELGGIDQEITVFFSDIRGFTTLSESLSPQDLVRLLNSYFTIMTDIIFEFNGTLDKYIGDAIMCFWGAPKQQLEHVELACKTALKHSEKLKVFNENLSDKLKLNIGIGINTGIMTVGNMGSEGKLNYTLTGDNVNLGSRLEGTNKIYGTNIIVSEYTYNKVKDKFIFRELDKIRVKGKLKPISIYELLSERE